MSNLAWTSALLLLTQGSRPATVGALGDPARWELAGVRSFEARSVIGAVLGVGELRVAARAASPREKFLRLVETSIRSGYQHAGFVEAKVTAAPSAEDARLVIQVEEGPQAFAGTVRVEGNKQVASGAITAACADLWKPGAPAPADPLTLARAWRLAANCYAENGFFAARGEAAVRTPVDGAAALEVRVAEEGQASTVTRLQIDGDGDDPTAIAARIGFVPGTVWSTRAREDLVRRLRALGRYLDIELDDQTRDAEGRIDPLRVTLTRAPKLPAWDQMPWDDLALLARGVAWLRAQLTAGAPVHIHVRHNGEQTLQGGLSLGPGKAEMIASVGAITTFVDFLRYRGMPLGEWTLVLRPHDVQLLGAGGALTLPFDTMRAITWHLLAGPQPRDERGDNVFRTIFYFHIGPLKDGSAPVQFDVDVQESILLHGLTLARVTPVGSETTLTIEGREEDRFFHADVDRTTGAVRFHARLENPDWTLTFDFRPDAAMSQPVAAATSQPRNRDLSTLLAEAIEPAVALLFQALGVEDRTSHRLLWVVGRLVIDRPRQSRAHEPQATFEIPGADPAGGQGLTLLTARWALRAITEEVRLDSWLHGLLTDVAEVWLNEVQDERVAAWESLQRHLRDPRCGPVARWAFAEVLAYANKPEMAALFAHSAKDPLDPDAAWRDVAMVAGETVLSAVGAAWAGDESPELRALFGADAASKPPLEIARAGFAHLWTKAFERPLRDRLRALDR